MRRLRSTSTRYSFSRLSRCYTRFFRASASPNTIPLESLLLLSVIKTSSKSNPNQETLPLHHPSPPPSSTRRTSKRGKAPHHEWTPRLLVGSDKESPRYVQITKCVCWATGICSSHALFFFLFAALHCAAQQAKRGISVTWKMLLENFNSSNRLGGVMGEERERLTRAEAGQTSHLNR